MASQEEKDKLHKSLDKFMKRYTPDRRVVCFGNNDITAETIKVLNENKISVSCIFDNGCEGKNEDGIAVVHPQNYKLSKRTVILIGSKYYNEMKEQLLELGYTDKQIIQTTTYVDMYVPKTTLKEFFNQLHELTEAKKIYKRLSGNMGRNGILFVSPAKSIGDIYLILMYTKAYVKSKGIKNFRYVITGGAAEAVCRACGVSNYIKISIDEMLMLRKFVRFMDIPDKKVMVCNEIWAYTNLGKNIIGYGKYNNFSLCYKKSVLAVKEDNMHPECPLLKYDGDIHKIFHDNNLIEGKTVLLAPYTNYLKPLPNKIWIEIADRLKKRGFSVCTNCASESEKPIYGSLPINLGFDEICSFIETAGYFIGARSGLCDVISSSNADIHIIYQQHMESKFISSAEYYSLNKMELVGQSNVREYVWDSQDTAEAIADRIIFNIDKNV